MQGMDWAALAAACLGAYLLGSVPFAVIVSRLMGLADPRSFGSGNPGATNVLRSGSKSAAALTLLLDAAKGWLPVALVGWWGLRYGLGAGAQTLVGLCAFAGHVWPVFLRFKGGKGVATALGVLLGISPWLGLLVAGVWLLALAGSRMSSLSSLLAAAAAPIIYWLGSGLAWGSTPQVPFMLGVMAVILFYRHSSNIARLLAGTEPKVGQKSAAPHTTATAHAPAPRLTKAQRKKRNR